MSNNIKISIYITISISALIFLLISFVSIKASFGGLNLNIFSERISDELKLNYSFDADIENIVLKRSSENGFYLDIEKIQIIDANGFVLETNLISWDFNLFNLILLNNFFIIDLPLLFFDSTSLLLYIFVFRKNLISFSEILTLSENSTIKKFVL